MTTLSLTKLKATGFIQPRSTEFSSMDCLPLELQHTKNRVRKNTDQTGQ